MNFCRALTRQRKEVMIDGHTQIWRTVADVGDYVAFRSPFELNGHVAR